MGDIVYVPRLKPSNWNGRPVCLWKPLIKIHGADNTQNPEIRYILDEMPLVAIGIDQSSSIAYPNKETLLSTSGISEDELYNQACSFLVKQDPVWETLDGGNLSGLVYVSEYASEQILNPIFMAQAAERLKCDQLLVSVMTSSCIMVHPPTEEAADDFIQFCLIRYATKMGDRITTLPFVVNADGRMGGIVAFDPEMAEDIISFVHRDNDIEIEPIEVERGNQIDVDLEVSGKNTTFLVDAVWSAVLRTTSRYVDPKSRFSGNINVVFIGEKSPDRDVILREILPQLKSYRAGLAEVQDFMNTEFAPETEGDKFASPKLQISFRIRN